jgi:dihydroorotase
LTQLRLTTRHITGMKKEVEFDQAANGVIGLETALPLTMTLVAAGVLSLSEAVRKLTVNPAQVFALPYGTLTVGAPADVAIFDPAHSWLVDVTRLRSKSKNSPFDKWELKGKVVVTMVGGRIVHDERTIGC